MKNKPIFLALMILVLISSLAARPVTAQAASELTCTKYHTVQRGEYLSQIARKYGVSWRWLAEINKLANSSRIYPNQSLCVEVQETPVETVCTQYHTVARGEYLSQIARKYGVSWRWLAEINKLADPSRIYTGQQICVATSTG